MRRVAAAILCLLVTPGCVIVQVGATNPIPGLTTVAVAPFFNLSQEPEFVADGRRMALAYYAELQKVPGYQVIPVGVVEQAIRENDFELSRPDDALELCRILNCDAVVVGAITDYDPYYPPRLGLQVSWYSPYPWVLEPGMPVDPLARRMIRRADAERQCEEFRRKVEETRDRLRCRPGCRRDCCADDARETLIRAQSDALPRVAANRRMSLSQPARGPMAGEAPLPPDLDADPAPLRGVPCDIPPGFVGCWVQDADNAGVSRFLVFPAAGAAWGQPQPMPAPTGVAPTAAQPRSVITEGPSAAKSASGPHLSPSSRPAQPPGASGLLAASAVELTPQPALPGAVPLGPVLAFDPRRPFMSYTRLFDGADADVCATLRDWLELSGDQRAGTWEAALHRTDEFVRFCSHRMIVEMLMLHGGDAQRRVVFKFRRYR